MVRTQRGLIFRQEVAQWEGFVKRRQKYQLRPSSEIKEAGPGGQEAPPTRSGEWSEGGEAEGSHENGSGSIGGQFYDE